MIPAEASLPNGTAKRLRKRVANAPDTVTMATVLCEQCGEQFAIGHRSAAQNPALANRQAVWLADQFVWDHIQEAKHHSSIRLPGSNEIK
ncbi:MAG: hypothetical protein ACRD2R_02165 [Terriglobales bacterium]